MQHDAVLMRQRNIRGNSDIAVPYSGSLLLPKVQTETPHSIFSRFETTFWYSGSCPPHRFAMNCGEIHRTIDTTNF